MRSLRRPVRAYAGVHTTEMVHCKYPGCNRKNAIKDGRCRTHHDSVLFKSPTKKTTDSIQNQALKKSIIELNERLAQLEKENLALNNQMGDFQEFAKSLVQENSLLREDNNLLRDKINKANYHVDSVDQYNS